MPNMLTATGTGQAIVLVSYEIDSFGDAEITSVMYRGVDILDALDEDALTTMQTEAINHNCTESDTTAAEMRLERMEG